MPLEQISADEGHVCGALDSVLITFWRATPTVYAATARAPWVDAAVERYSALAYLIVVEESAGVSNLPRASFVKESRRQMKQVRHLPGFAALVVEGTGVTRSLVRTFLRGQARFSSERQQAQHFDNVRDASRWIGAQLAPYDGPTGSAIFVAAEACRAAK